MPTLTEDIERLRAIPAKWKGLRDPLGDLAIIRHGDDERESTRHFWQCAECGEHYQCSEYERLWAIDTETERPRVSTL